MTMTGDLQVVKGNSKDCYLLCLCLHCLLIAMTSLKLLKLLDKYSL